ncbi:Pathogenesis-related protein 1 [Euphorbia peplus]|nr:Pathogenesis-related protein 1 [Euphorbia peplus]
MSQFNISLALLSLLCLAMAHRSDAQNTQQNYLDAHNIARAQVRVANITWDATLATYAQNYANSMIGSCNLVHSNGPYGENLAKGSSSSFSGTAAVNLWVQEKQYYNYTSNSCIGGNQCLHYTQVVWRNSVRLGCARVPCNNGWWFITCNYDTPGNYVDQKPY